MNRRKRRTLTVVLVAVLMTLSASVALAAPTGPGGTATGETRATASLAADREPTGKTNGTASSGTNGTAWSAPSSVYESHDDRREPEILSVSTRQTGTAAVDSPASMIVSLTARQDVENVSVRFYHSSEVLEVSAASVVSTVERLDRGQRTRLPVTATLSRQIRAASAIVTVEISGTVDGETFTRREAIEVSTGSGATSVDAPDREDMVGMPTTDASLAVAAADGERTTGGTSAEATDGTTSDTTTVSGTFVYDDDTGTAHPGRQLVVTAWDEDADGSELLASGTTDSSGSFSLSFDPNTDEETGESGTADVFVTIDAQNPAATVTTDSQELYYLYTSPTSDVQPGVAYTTGTLRPSSSTFDHVFQAADWVFEEYQYVRTNAGGYTRPRVRVEFPAGDWPVFRFRYSTVTGAAYRSSEQINLPEKTEAYWDESTVYHEYGHALMLPMYDWNGFEWPQGGTYNCHYVASETDPGFAVKEGWAAFMEGAVSGDPSSVRFAGDDLETNEWYDLDYDPGPCPGADAGELDGNAVEGSFAAALFDLVDTGNANDEPLEEPFHDVFDTVADNNVQSGTDFVAAWRADGRGEGDAVARTFARYGVVEPVCERCEVATDVDGDDRYEDVDGDGDLTFFDVLVLYDYFQRDGTSPAVAPFDFDENGEFTFFDVLALYDEFQSA